MGLDWSRLSDDLIVAAIALGLTIGALLTLPKHRRWQVWLPIFLLVIFGGLQVWLGTGPRRSLASMIRIAAHFLLLCSIARAGFLLVVDGLIARRRHVPQILKDVMQGLVFGAVALVTAQKLGVDIGDLLTTSALLTAVIGLSLQETLVNMVAGLAMQVQPPFGVGDWIQWETHIGRVVDLNWRSTTIRTNDELEVVIPNGPLARAGIVNFSRPGTLVRRSIRVPVPFQVPPHRVEEAIREALADVPGVRSEPLAVILPESFEANGVIYWVRYFIDEFQSREAIDGRVRARIWYALSRADIQFPVPTRNVHILQDDEAQRRQQEDERVERRAFALRSVDFLGTMPEEVLRTLARRVGEVQFGADEEVIRQGEPGDELYIVRQGEVTVWIASGEGEGTEEREVATLGAGGFFGEMSLMTGAKRMATVRTKVPTELYVVGKAALSEVVAARPELLAQISATLAARQAALERAGERVEEAEKPEVPVEALLARIRGFFRV